MRLPPLNALRAFEAAARHNGYIAAADELHVTRGAISRHVKLLEQHLGVSLFRRHHQGVDLTEPGAALQKVLAQSFGAIAAETRRITAQANELRIICPPTLSIRWLFPHLDGFRARHPDIRLRLTTDFYGEGGFDAGEHDLGVSMEHWPGRSPDLQVQPLFPLRLSPACAPELIAASPRLENPATLASRRLLHVNAHRADWPLWAARFAPGSLDTDTGEFFPNLDMAVRAATLGAGIVMADIYLCQEELSSGQLCLPFPDMSCPTDHGRYALIGPADRWHDPKVKAFRAWAEELSGALITSVQSKE
ncbi:LysR substrate-binding domain-containing protein [Shimia sp. W99]